MNKIKKMIVFFVLSSIFIAFDQFTKYQAFKYLADGRVIPLIEGVLELVYAKNTGAAFGILQGMDTFFYVMTFIVCIFIIKYIYIMPKSKRYLPLFVSFIFVFSGAIGNIIDRVLRSYVIDFIYFKPIDFPVFNVADIYISLSMGVLFYLFIFYYKEEEVEFLSSKRKKNEKNSF